VSRHRVTILGIPVDAVTCEEALDVIDGLVSVATPSQLVTVNPEFVMAAQTNPQFKDVLCKAALALPDGIGMIWAARVLGQRLPERVAGSDLVPRLAGIAAQRGWSLFLLGAAPGIADKAAAVLSGLYPRLRVVGTYSGSPAPSEEEHIIELVRAAAPDVLLVAYGAPAQDLWIARNMESLAAPLCLGIGGTLDFIAGARTRAPRWVRRIGLEWLFRLLQEPWRWRRQLALPTFAVRVLWSRATHHARGQERG